MFGGTEGHLGAQGCAPFTAQLLFPPLRVGSGGTAVGTPVSQVHPVRLVPTLPPSQARPIGRLEDRALLSAGRRLEMA